MSASSPNKPLVESVGHIDDHQGVSDANARAGLWLFFVYLAAYAGFMGLAVLAPRAMGQPVLAGVNLAITYGMGLIAGALVVAAVYMWLCGRNARAYNDALFSDASQKREATLASQKRAEGRQ